MQSVLNDVREERRRHVLRELVNSPSTITGRCECECLCLCLCVCGGGVVCWWCVCVWCVFVVCL